MSGREEDWYNTHSLFLSLTPFLPLSFPFSLSLSLSLSSNLSLTQPVTTNNQHEVRVAAHHMLEWLFDPFQLLSFSFSLSHFLSLFFFSLSLSLFLPSGLEPRAPVTFPLIDLEVSSVWEEGNEKGEE